MSPKKNMETPHKLDLEGDSNTDKTEDVDLFVQKILLQNRVLKKIAEGLTQNTGEGNEEIEPESTTQQK